MTGVDEAEEFTSGTSWRAVDVVFGLFMGKMAPWEARLVVVGVEGTAGVGSLSSL